MGFPTWTLVGMGLTVAGALVALLLAYLAQSPRLLKRLGLAGYRLDLRARTFTGYALALLLLSLGFFLAGVPLGDAAAVAVVEANSTSETAAPAGTDVAGTVVPQGETMTEVAATASITPTIGAADAVAATPGADSGGGGATGAFGSAPPDAAAESAADAGADAAPAGAGAAVAETPLAPAEAPAENAPGAAATAPTEPPTATPSPTVTPSPTTTATPTPTPTPTAVVGETAVINVGSSTLWLKRTPGGQDLSVVRGGDLVLLLPGHANMGGSIWQEVATLDGTIGWVEEAYLDVTPPEAQP